MSAAYNPKWARGRRGRVWAPTHRRKDDKKVYKKRYDVMVKSEKKHYVNPVAAVYTAYYVYVQLPIPSRIHTDCAT